MAQILYTHCSTISNAMLKIPHNFFSKWSGYWEGSSNFSFFKIKLYPNYGKNILLTGVQRANVHGFPSGVFDLQISSITKISKKVRIKN